MYLYFYFSAFMIGLFIYFVTKIKGWNWQNILSLIFQILIVLFFCSIMKTKADDILIGQKTHHFKEYANWDICPHKRTCVTYNDSQELIGYATDNYSFVYLHQNSIRNKSFIITRNFKYDLTENIRPYAAVGFSTGYESYKHAGVFAAMGYFGVDIHPSNDKFGLLVTWQPESFIGLGLRIKL